MNLYCNSFRIWLLPILFCVLCGNLRAQEWLTVEDGNTSSPYYTFETIQQVPIDISTYGFQRGQSYAFLPQGVSTNHPFMIGEHNGDLNSSLLSVVGGGTVTPLTYNTSNLMITIPSNYSGNLVYFSTTDTSVHYYLSIVDPPGGNYQSSGGGYQSGGGGYQSPGSSYQPVYDLNASHLTNLSVQVNQSLAGKYSFFNRTNSSGSPEIRLELMEVATGQWQPQGIASSLYYLAKPDLFPSIPHIYDYLTSINLSPVNGYKPPGVNYQSSGSGYSSPPIYETTATLIVNNQPTSITGIPRAATGSTWYQSFTAENSAKLTKFAFATNGSFSATADVTIREGEGVAGNILHSGTWTGLGSNTNSFNEYEITNEVLLTSGQKYTIQLENQTAGGFIGSNPGQYNGGMFYYSGYSGEYGDLKMKIWGQLKATGNAIDIISPATNDQNITDDNHTLTISYNYQSDSGGYQTPTWAYRIDSGFPSYGSPHGGTQVTGSRTKNNFLSGQTYGSKTVYVALLDQNGNLHNPPITLNRTLNYQSSGGGYSSPGGGYSSPGSGYSSPNSGYTSPSDGYNSPDSGYSTPANGYSSPGDGYSSPNSGYTSPSDGYNSPDSGYSTPANGYNSPGDGYSSPNSGYTSPSDGYNSPDSGYSTPANGYSSPGEGYSSPDSGYSSPSDGYESIPALLAFVNTVGHESDQDGIILSGEILGENDTNNDNIMVGFLLSTNIDLLLNDPFTQKVIGEFKNEGLFTGNFNSTLDGVIYYKAFAENEMGVSYGKVNKIAVIKSTNSQGQSPTEKAISTLGEDSIELPGGWNDNSWFGLYKVYENGWIYHSAHGWLYLSADSSDGIWAWSEKRSWVWSSKEIYPFLYQPSIGNWIYFLTSKNGQVYFFNYSTNLVEVNIP